MPEIIPIIKKYALHFAIWTVMVFYLSVADDVYARIFLQDTPGIPTLYDWQIPSDVGEIKYKLGGLGYVNRNLYRFTGWAVYKNLKKTENYDRYLVLRSDRDTYYFPIKPGRRFFIQISSDFIRPGEYRVGILFKDKAGKEDYFIETSSRITHTPNFLYLGNQE